MGCTQKADVSKYLDEVKIPENCKNLVPPLINSEIWNNLFPNVQQRDKTLQDAQRILGLSIVPMISLAEMFKTNKFEMIKAKKCVSDAITLACNAMYELNVRRRFILRPFVHKRFQQLCAATTPIEGKTLFPYWHYKTYERNFWCVKNKQAINTWFSSQYPIKKLQGKNELPRKDKSIQSILSRRRQVKPVKRFGLQPRTRQSGVQQIPAELLDVSNLNFVAGGLANKIREWEKITSDWWILNTILGYKIEFDEIPFQNKIPVPIKFNEKQTDIIDQEVIDLLNKNAINVSKFEANQFISNIFIVEKKNGKFRPVINLMKLNEFITYHHFKMETLDVVLSSIKRNSFFVSIDLKDACLSVPIYKNDRKYLKFFWKGVLFNAMH